MTKSGEAANCHIYYTFNDGTDKWSSYIEFTTKTDFNALDSRVAGLEGNFKYSSPVGTVLPYSGETAPFGWFICNGRTLDANGYKELFSVIGYKYGGGGGAFCIPDMREVVPVGIGTRDANITHDTYTLGQFKDDAIQDHEHKFSDFLTGGRIHDGRRVGSNSCEDGFHKIWGTLGAYGARTANVTRGKRIGMNYIIHAASLIKVNGSGWSPA